jgi:hypothetical protein
MLSTYRRNGGIIGGAALRAPWVAPCWTKLEGQDLGAGLACGVEPTDRAALVLSTSPPVAEICGLAVMGAAQCQRKGVSADGHDCG